MSYGTQIKVGFARQTAGGTAVTAVGSFHGFALTNEDVGLEKDELISQNLIGRFEQGAIYDGINRVTGTINFEVTPRNLLTALAMAVNHAPPVLASSGSVRTHEFMPNTSDFDATYVKAPFTMYKQFSDATSAEQFFDLQFGGLSLAFAQGQFLNGTLTLAGGARSPTGTGSANIGPDTGDVGQLFPWNVSSVSLGGVALNEQSEISVSLNENIEALYTINGTLSPFKFSRTTFREVTVQGTFYMDDRNILNDFVAGTQRRLLVTAMNTRTAVQSGYFNTLTIDIPQLKITAFKPGASGPGEVSVSFTGRGVIDPSSNYSMRITTVSTWTAGF